ADANGCYVNANAAAEAMLGYTTAELRQMRVADVVVATSSWTGAEYDRMKRLGRWQGIVRLRSKDGRFIVAEAHAGPLNDPQGALYASVLRALPTSRSAAEHLT